MSSLGFSMSSWLEGQDGYDVCDKREPLARRGAGPVAVGFTSRPRAVRGDWREPVVGDRVQHRAFGLGVVRAYDPGRRAVRAEFGGTPRTFLFPDAFSGGFLSYGPEA